MGRTTGWLGGSEFDLNGSKFAKPPVLCQDGITFHCKTLDSGTSGEVDTGINGKKPQRIQDADGCSIYDITDIDIYLLISDALIYIYGMICNV